VIPLTLLKSARQQGVVEFVPALQLSWAATNRVYCPVHAAALATIRHVAPRQHDPVVIGQGRGRHATSLPRYVFGVRHAARAETVQTAAGVQHAPCGCGQLLGVQVVAAPWNEPGHNDASPVVHVPSAAQHAPVGETTHPLLAHTTVACQVAIPLHAE
jgi:hypothetical protein